MGICGSQLSQDEKEERAKSTALQKRINRRQRADEEIHKLLLLGAGESGKSTLFKQMISIYGKGFSSDDREMYKTLIFNNIALTCQQLCERTESGNWGSFQTDEAKAASAFFTDASEQNDSLELDMKVAGHVHALWADPGFQQTYKARANFQLKLNDSFEYYVSRVDAICEPGYTPSDPDILRCRAKTTGILKKDFVIEEAQFAMYDVGGQRNERKKWIHCFQDKVRAVLFVSAISEYDQVLAEDDTMNRMHESINLFDQIVNSEWFQQTSVIVFLNKSDLFRKKILQEPSEFKACFPDFEGDVHDFDDTSDYVRDCFHACFEENDDKELEETVFIHVTCATNTENVTLVFKGVRAAVLHRAMQEVC